MTPFDLPTFEAHWWPVHLETVPGSGEALTVAVVVRAASGQASIRQAIAPASLNTLFGQAGKGMQLVVGNTVLILQRQLDAGTSVEALEMPFGNTALGQPRDCVARDYGEVFEIAMRLSTAFSQSQFGNASASNIDQEARAAFAEWADKVRTQVILAQAANGLSHAFNVPVPLGGRKKATVGFVYGDYLAQFGVLRPGKTISPDERGLKLKLFDIQMLRREKSLQFQRAELIVGYQAAGDLYTRRQRESLAASWDFIEREARARDVTLVQCTTAADAARHLSIAVT